MSARIPLWQHLTSTVMREAPLTGLGYYAASRVYAIEFNRGLGNAHSAFFEVLLGGGLVAVYVLPVIWDALTDNSEVSTTAAVVAVVIVIVCASVGQALPSAPPRSVTPLPHHRPRSPLHHLQLRVNPPPQIRYMADDPHAAVPLPQ